MTPAGGEAMGVFVGPFWLGFLCSCWVLKVGQGAELAARRGLEFSVGWALLFFS